MMHSIRQSATGLLSACTLIAAIGCASMPDAHLGMQDDKDAPRLYDGFGNYHRSVSTTSAEAQKWFDQAMQLLYGFNHDEAIRSFHQATKHDPDCAMAWWGVAYAHGLHINNPEMGEEQSIRAYEAAQEALKRIDKASPVERALILAVSRRYEMPVPEDRSHLDRDYADAMQEAWETFPNDPDVGALFAESLMNLQPWDLWTKDGQPKGRTLEIVDTLEKVLAINVNHPGANHFYIHAVEASPDPHRAIPHADRLRALVPGSGHLVHMPAHIYARVGRWDDASDANEEAIQADRAYFAVAPEPEFYSLYFVHNLHFLAWAAMMEGRYETAMRAARELERDIPEAFLRDWTFVADGFTPVTYHVMIRFGKWEDILAEPEPKEHQLVKRASRRYARGVALAALGRTYEARDELAAFEEAASSIPEDWLVGNNSAEDVMKVARKMLRGELAYREGRLDEAFSLLREGAELEDALAYDEPPGWMQPVRHALGALLMAEGRAAEAEQVYRDDLERHPNNGWALLGLRDSLRAQGKAEAASEVEPKLAAAWRRADVRPVASCYCHPDAR
jgi:tetratricopeptide (TPR) repeat protein